MGRYKKYLTILLMFSIHMMPFNAARATTVSAEGWSVSKRLVQGATTFYDGTKNIVLNGKNYAATGTAAITPAAGQVAKMIVRTGAVLAVDLAIKTLIGAVDYVMDPANNQVKYYVEPTSTSPKPTDQYIWRYSDSVNGTHDYSYSVSASSMCSIVLSLWSGKTPWKYDRVSLSSSSTTSIVCYLSSTTTTYNGNSGISRVNNPAYDPNAQPNREEKYLPYDAVASQIIGDAAAEKADGKAYVSSVADTALDNDEQKQIVPASNVTQQLNNSQSIPTNGTATGTSTPTTGTGDPAAPTAPPTNITLNFPVFCGWAPTVCQAAQAVLDFPKTFESWEKSITDWVKEPSSSKDQLEFSDPNIPEPDTQINLTGGCPQKIPLVFTWNGHALDFSFDFTIWCQAISTFVYPIVVSLGALHALYIVTGVRQDG